MESVKLLTLTAGTTVMGADFNIALQMLQDEQQMLKRSYLPSIVLVSDGQLSDD